MKQKQFRFWAVCLALIFAGSFNSVWARSLIIPDANNQYDLVSGEPIREKRFNTTYQGKRYWFNSYANVQRFQKNPEEFFGTARQQQAAPRRQTQPQAEPQAQPRRPLWSR